MTESGRGRPEGAGAPGGMRQPDMRRSAPRGQAPKRRPPAPGQRPPRRAAVQTLGKKRRRSPLPLIIIVLVLLLAAGGGATWWVLTRPASIAITSDPSDATITFTGLKAKTGSITGKELKPGSYQLSMQRTGFKPLSLTVELTHGQNLTKRYSLTPLPFAMSFTSQPKGASVKVVRNGAVAFSGVTPCKATVPAGQLDISITKAGFNTFDKAIFLDAAQPVDLVLDPKGQLVHSLGTIPMAGAPKGVIVTPDGKEAWSAILNGPPSIQICDPRSGKLLGKGIDMGSGGAVEICFNRAGTKAYASQMETKGSPTSKVYEIDVATRKTLRVLDTKSTMTKVVVLSPDDKTLYAANWSGNNVSVIDLKAGQTVHLIATSKTPRGLYPTADGKTLYVAGFDKGDIDKVDLATYRLTKIFSSGGAMRHLVADEKRGILYASDMAKDTVYEVDMKTDKVTVFCKTDHKPNTIALSPDNKVLFISNRGENNPKSYYIPGYEWGSILLMDTATGRPLDAIVGGNQCTALAVSADGTLLVFSDFLDNRLRAYEVPSYDKLVAGNGGRYAVHFAELKKTVAGTYHHTGPSN